MIEIKKGKFALSLVIAFVIGIVLTAGVSMFRTHSSTAVISNEKLKEIQNQIDTYYLNDYKKEDVAEGVYRGYVNGLGDPYSVYMSKEEYESWIYSAKGVYSGVGITFGDNGDGRAQVISVNPKSPADKAGVEPGDYILDVDGKKYDNADVMAAAIRGKEGTEVTLTIYHNKDEKKITMTRAKIIQESVAYKMLEGNVGYISINSFIENTDKDFDNALKALEKKGASKLIVDLRDNGGGLVDASVNIADVFLDEGPICYLEDRKGNREPYKAEDGKTDMETVVLVNENSASASEILAGALKDNGYTLVGKKTFGKGVIQSTVTLEDGSALKLTIMQYLSPKMHKIHEKGITPDYIVEENEDTKADEQLEKAEDLLRD